MKTTYTLLLFIFLSLFAQSAKAQDSQLIELAKTQLPKWLAKIPLGSELKYGFSSRKEMDDCLLGQAIQMITLEKDEKGNNRIKRSNDWRIPVVYQGDFRTLSTISNKNGRYEFVGIGGNLLAKELQRYARYFVNNNVYLLRLYTLQMDFLVVASLKSSIEQGTYYPLQSAQQKIGTNKELSLKNTYTYTQFIAIVHQLESK